MDPLHNLAVNHGLEFANHCRSRRIETRSLTILFSKQSREGDQMKLILGLSALAGALVTATPALAVAAQANATANAYGVVLQPLTLTKVSDLNFGTIIGSAAAGTVTINADTGVRSVTGGITAVTNYPGGRGTFQGAGQSAQIVKLALTPLAQLVSTTNPANTVTVTSLSLDSSGATRTIDATQAFTVGVGGVFTIAANQPNGTYTASFDLTADYQ